MRYTEPVQFKLEGSRARNYISQARTFLGKMLEIFSDSPDGQNWKTTLPDGTQFSAYLPAKGMIPIVHIVSNEIKPTEINYNNNNFYLILSQYWENNDYKILYISNGGDVWRSTTGTAYILYQIDAASGKLIEIPGFFSNLPPEGRITVFPSALKGNIYYTFLDNIYAINYTREELYTGQSTVGKAIRVDDGSFTENNVIANSTKLKSVGIDAISAGITDQYYVLDWRADLSYYGYHITDHGINDIPSIPIWFVQDRYPSPTIIIGEERELSYPITNKYGITKKRKDPITSNIYSDQYTFDGQIISVVSLQDGLNGRSFGSHRIYKSPGVGKDFWAISDTTTNYIIINHIGEKIKTIDISDILNDIEIPPNYYGGSDGYMSINITFSEKYVVFSKDYQTPILDNNVIRYSYYSDIYIYSYSTTNDGYKTTDINIDQPLTSPIHKILVSKKIDSSSYPQGSLIFTDRAHWYST